MTRTDEPVLARLAAAMELHRAGDLAGAARVYRDVLASLPAQPDALHLLGVIALQQGDLREAIARIGAAIAVDPGAAAYHSNLGNAWRKSGEFARAAACYDAALVLDPGLLDARYTRALAHHAAAAYEAAIADYLAVLAAVPGHDDARNNLGAAFLASGRAAEALAAFDLLLQHQPDLASAHRNRGQALVALGRDAQAGRAFERAVELAPADAESLGCLAALRHAGRRLDEAIALYARADAADPGNPRTLNDLGVAYLERGRADLAAEKLLAAIRLQPRSASAHTNLANALRALGQGDRAIELYRAALALDPTVAETYDNLATTLRDRGQLDEAVASYEAALQLKPGFTGARGNLANLQLERGDMAGALKTYRLALAEDPGSVEIHRNMLLAMLYDPGLAPRERFAAHVAFAERHAPANPLPAPAPRPADLRRLRVGYLSSDLREHPVARSLGPILAAHDRNRFEIFVYSDAALPDATTRHWRAHVDQWRDTVGEDDAMVAARVRADAIDVLVCVAGRFDRNRPLVAAWRPAPVQLSLFEIATTGIAAYDGIFADRYLVPRLGSESFAERPIRLPVNFVHAPLPDIGAPGLPPSAAATAAGPVFGCFNNPVKVNDAVLDLWVNVLRAVPGSRLLLKYKNLYAVPSIAARVRAAFVRGGVEPSRADLRSGSDGHAVHMALYDRVDVALDPFPFSGSTATFEALWMGVPVVTLSGQTMSSRWTGAMLAALGRREWIAGDAGRYVEIAANLAADGKLRAELRANLRAAVAASPLCDGRRRARQIERVCRALWRIKTSGGRR